MEPIWVVVDVANVLGSRPDGWWRDRRAAAERLLAAAAGVVGAAVTAPDGTGGTCGALVAVLEGQARRATVPDAVKAVRAEADGDSAVVAEAERCLRSGVRVVVVTADRGLRRRLPGDALVVGPNWLNALIGR